MKLFATLPGRTQIRQEPTPVDPPPVDPPPVNQPLTGTAIVNDDWAAENEIMTVESVGGGLRFSTTEWDAVFDYGNSFGGNPASPGKWRISWEVVNVTGEGVATFKLFNFDDVVYDFYKEDGTIINEPLVLGARSIVFDEAASSAISSITGTVNPYVEIEDPGATIDIKEGFKVEAI